MLGNWFNRTPLSRVKTVQQITASHCGAAVLEMLFYTQGISAGQNEIAWSAGVEHRIESDGMVIEELATASRTLAPQLQFWYKLEATISDLARIVNEYKHPVGVEWQGIFLPEDQDEDDGHYSLVTGADTTENTVTLVDPYYARERKFTVMEFQRRWWDVNETYNPNTGRVESMTDKHLLFILTTKKMAFPETLGMSRG
jgi:ABC-type bacteriocin/lantibiotic exporter with double-glycine peptidase domain